MNTAARSLHTLADSLASTFPCCDDAPLALALLDELAKGDPVSVARLARAVDCDEAELTATLDRWPNVHRGGQAEVVAFGGLSVTATRHRFEVAGRQLYTWCAWDTLFLPALLRREAHVESTLRLEDAVELGRLATQPLIEDGRPQRESGAAGALGRLTSC
jgi:alkylmercury lyase